LLCRLEGNVAFERTGLEILKLALQIDNYRLEGRDVLGLLGGMALQTTFFVFARLREVRVEL